jgi:hypothetical protein
MLLVISFLLCASPAFSQDAAQQAMQASQQAAQMAQQANMQATQAAQQANMQAMEASQQAAQANMAALQSSQTDQWTPAPKFLLRPGTYPAGTVVRLRDRAPGAIIYYTTDGWTPTIHSARYTGPIALESDMTLQAIAIAAYRRPSMVVAKNYRVRSGTTSATAGSLSAPKPLSAPISLPLGTPVKLAFTRTINSNTAQIGDPLPLVLADNLVIHGYLVAAKGTPALGRVTAVNSNGALGRPGEITFRVTALDLPGARIPLFGQETMAGSIPIKTMRTLLWIPAVGMSSLLIHGKDAIIPSGALLTAHVSKAITITPEQARITQPATP